MQSATPHGHLSKFVSHLYVQPSLQLAVSVAAAGLFHDITGTLNGRLLPGGEMVYGTTCNLSISLAHVNLDFDTDFTIASFEDLDWCFSAKQLGISVRS